MADVDGHLRPSVQYEEEGEAYKDLPRDGVRTGSFLQIAGRDENGAVFVVLSWRAVQLAGFPVGFTGLDRLIPPRGS